MRLVARLAAALLAAVALAACSGSTMTRLAYANAALAYDNLGSALAWAVDEYVDLTDEQETWVRQRIARTLEWHRSEELPRYRRMLEGMLARSDGAFSAEDLAALWGETRAGYLRVNARVVPDVGEFLATMDAEQVAHMEKKMSSDVRKFVRESVRGTPEERRRRRLTRLLEHLEAWIGPVNDAQHAILAAAFRETPDFTEEMAGERRYRQSELLNLARAKPPKAEMEAQLKRLFVDMDAWRRAEYREEIKARDARLFEALAAVSATLTPKQRSALQSRIKGLIRDIDKLTTAS